MSSNLNHILQCYPHIALNAVEAQLFDQKIFISDGTCSDQTGGMSCTNFGQARANKPLGHDSQEADTNTVLELSLQATHFEFIVTGARKNQARRLGG